jgi:uncharacterized protein
MNSQTQTEPFIADGNGLDAEMGEVIEAMIARSATSELHSPLFERLFGPVPSTNSIRVLSLDGGGARGIISMSVVVELVKRSGRTVSELFDHVAGTSTGSILACALVAPHPGNPAVARWQAQPCFAAYIVAIQKVLSVRGVRERLHAANLFEPKFFNDALNEELHRVIGDSMLSEAILGITVPAYEITDRRAVLFSAADARSSAEHDFKLWEVARASSAAPTLFEPHEMYSRTGVRHVLIDGGVIANNPSMAAFTDIERRGESRDIAMMSIGTGAASYEFGWPEVQHWGIAQWARPMLRLLLDSSSQAVDFELRHVLGKRRYLRFQIDIPRKAEALDDASDVNVDRLLTLGQELIKRNDEMLDQACELLVR